MNNSAITPTGNNTYTANNTTHNAIIPMTKITENKIKNDLTVIPKRIEKTIKFLRYSFFNGEKNVFSNNGNEKK